MVTPVEPVAAVEPPNPYAQYQAQYNAMIAAQEQPPASAAQENFSPSTPFNDFYQSGQFKSNIAGYTAAYNSPHLQPSDQTQEDMQAASAPGLPYLKM